MTLLHSAGRTTGPAGYWRFNIHHNGSAMNRDNQKWIDDLSRDGAKRELALRDLRDVLTRNLRKALSGRRADESFLEDVVQDSLLRILDRLGQFEGHSRFVTWATTIAIHIAFGELRRSRWKDVSLDDVMAESNFMPKHAVDVHSVPGLRSERQSILDALHDAIENQLTDRQRTALLAELKGMPQEEIARHLGSNRNAVYKLTHDARKKLKTRLEQAGFSAEDVVTAN